MEAPHGVKSAIGNLVNAALTKGMAKSMMRLRMASKSIGFNRCELGMRGGVNGHRIRRACESGRK